MNLKYRTMSKEEKLKVQEYIKCNYDKMSITEMANNLGLSYNTVNKIKVKLGLTNKLNKSIEINEIQHQILLGGILGDGNFKKNGSNHYYREFHSELEKEYLLWKYENLKPFVTDKIQFAKKRTENQNDQYGFQTRNYTSLNKYADMTILEVIENLDELGILIWFLDDGWISKRYYKGNLSSCNFNVAGGELTNDEKNALIQKVEDITGIKMNLVGVKETDFRISTIYNEKIVALIEKYFDYDIDIIKKKILPIKNKIKI